MNPIKPKIIVILGPTATGKSDLAVFLAQKFNGEVISADSRQVYNGLNIGTGKITKREMLGVPHHLLDVASPNKVFTVAEFVNLADKAAEEIVARGRIPIICGGTGFYIQALVDGIILPQVTPDPELRGNLQEKSAAELWNILKKMDPDRAASIDVHNPHRLIRAIEIATALGKVPPFQKAPSKYEPLFIGLRLPDMELKERIRARLLKRLKGGMLREARRLHSNGLTWKRMEDLGLEYRYMARHLRGKISKEEMIEQLSMEIWHYAKRQMTWWKRDKRIKWLLPKEKAKIVAEIRRFLGT